jgi:hypothetical protein
MSFEFFTLLAYSPRGKPEIEISSRTVAGSCKNGDVSFNTRLSQRIKEADLSEYFANSALVPVPRTTLWSKELFFMQGSFVKHLSRLNIVTPS